MTTQRRPAKALAAIGLAMATAAAALAAGSVPGGAQVPDPQVTPDPTTSVPGDAPAADTPATTAPPPSAPGDAQAADIPATTAPPPSAPGGAQAAADPQVTLDPATDLVDGSRVTVTVTGFAANSSVEALQCPAGSGSFNGCDFGDAQGGRTDASGSASFELAVDATISGFDGDDGGATELDCRPEGACVIRVFGDFDAASVAEAPLAFDPDAPLAPPPTVAVDPSEGLTDGQSVTVTADGLVWSDSAIVAQCKPDPAGSGDCDFNTAKTFPVDAGGSGSAQFTVSAVLDIDGTPVDCREPGACSIVVTSGFGDSPRKLGAAPIAFDPDAEVVVPTLTLAPSADLVDGQTVTVTGSGFSGGFIELWECPSTPTSDSCQFTDFLENTGPGGTFTKDIEVSAIIFGDGNGATVDCRTAPEPCVLVASTGSVTSAHAGRATLAFRPDGPLVPGPTVTVDPSSNLPDQATVTVTGSGFTEEGFAILEVCRTGDSTACDPETTTEAQPDNNGSFTMGLNVAATFATDADHGSATVDCRAAPGCELVATDFSGNHARRGAAPLAFAPATAPSQTRFLDPIFDDVDVTQDVAYRTTTDAAGRPVTLTADIYQPAGDTAESRPALVWFPGGWFGPSGFGTDVSPAYAEAFAKRGYVVVVMDYRQRPGLRCCPTDDARGLTAAFLDAYDDAKAGVGWVRGHAADYRIDTRAIAAGGNEAGAATALHLADMPGQMGVGGSPSVKAAFGIGGVDLGTHDAGEAPTLALNTTANMPAPNFLAEWACTHSRRVGVVCETAAYEGVFGDLAAVRQRDATRRTTRFLVDAVLAPLGLAEPTGDSFTPLGSPAPVPGPAAPGAPAQSSPSTTTTTSQAHGTLPQTGTSATGVLLRIGLVLAAIGVVLVALTRARRRSDAGRLGLTGTVAVVISAVVVVSLIATACSKASDDKTDTSDTEHDMNAPGHDMDDMEDADHAETGDAGAGDHGGDDHGSDESAAGAMEDHGGGTGDGHGHGAGTGTGTGTGHSLGSTGHTSTGAHDPGDPGHNSTDPGHDNPGDPGHNNPGDPGHNNPGDPGHNNPGDPGHNNPGEPMPNGFDPNWTPEQTAFAQSLIDRTTASLPQFANPAILPLLGYAWIFDGQEVGTYQHWINTSRIVDSHAPLDPQFPESLVFRNTGDLPVLEAAMYMLGLQYNLNNLPADSAFLPGWHVHTNLCFDNDFRLVGVTVNGVCLRGHFVPTPPMLHVWIVDTPCGRFAGVDENGLQCEPHGHDH